MTGNGQVKYYGVGRDEFRSPLNSFKRGAKELESICMHIFFSTDAYVPCYTDSHLGDEAGNVDWLEVPVQASAVHLRPQAR